MITDYSLKNFRIFDSEGASFQMTPITILTGCNSSGKSSVVKSMMLLKECIKKAFEEYESKGIFNPAECHFDCSAEGLNLKSFDSTVYRASKNKEIILSYTAQAFSIPYKVEITFSAKDNDFFNFGWITKINIFTTKDEPILRASKNSKSHDDIVVDFLSMNNFMYFDFISTAYASTINYVKRKRNECYDIYGDLADAEEFKFWDDRCHNLIEKLANEYKDFAHLVVTAYEALEKVQIEDKYKTLFDSDLEKNLDIAINDSCLLYFPVLEHFRGVEKSEVRSILLNAKQSDYIEVMHGQEDFIADAKRIADAFEESNFDSFLEFYLSLEDDELNNVVKHQSDVYFSNYNKNFIEGVRIVAGIQYDENNPIHFTSHYPDEVNINMVYRFLSEWQAGEKDDEQFMSKTDTTMYQSSQVLYSAYVDFLSILLEKLLSTDIFDRLRYIGNFQSEVKRLYTFDDHSNKMGNAIKTFLENRSKLEAQQKTDSTYDILSQKSIYRAGDFTNKWIKKLGIGKSLNIVEDEDGLGAKVYVRKDSKRLGYPLADEGYGISQLVSFLLHIENEIIIDKLADRRYFPDDDRKSVQRSIPTLSLEEPEVSLHPSMQSILADIFYDAFTNYDIHFIVETHSEYLIRRTQAIVAGYKTSEEFEKKPFSVYYIGQGGKAYSLEYETSGRFRNSFGKGFFDEASRSSIEILKRERQMRNEEDA